MASDAAPGRSNTQKTNYVGRDLQAEAISRSDMVGALLARRDHMKERLSPREHLFLLLADPSSSRSARTFGILMWVIVLLSSFCFVYETMDWITDLTGPEPWLYAKMGFRESACLHSFSLRLWAMPGPLYRRTCTALLLTK